MIAAPARAGYTAPLPRSFDHPMAYSVRRFAWDDVPLLTASEAAHGPPASAAPADAVERMRRWLAQPGMQPERDCFIADEDGSPAGYAYLVVEQPISRGVLIFEAAQAGRRPLLDAAVSDARSIGLAVVQVDVPETDDALRSFLASAGLAHVRTHLHLRRDGARTIDAPLPAGAAIRSAGRDDTAALTDLQNAAFRGSWGYAPNTTETIAYGVFELPDDPPDRVLLLEEGGRLLAYCWTHQGHAGAPGQIGMVGTAPAEQSRGLGRAVTAAGVDHLVGIGATPIDITVDAENPPALRLYEHLGFTVRWRSVWYELRISG